MGVLEMADATVNCEKIYTRLRGRACAHFDWRW